MLMNDDVMINMSFMIIILITGYYERI